MAENTDETVIELSKPKILLSIVGSAVFVMIGVWLLSFAYVFGVISIAFFGFAGAYNIKRLLDRKPGLVFSSTGITDNASGLAAGFIPWSDIKGSRVYETHGAKSLVVLVKKPKHYIGRRNPIKRMLNKTNFSMVGSPISIPSSTLAMDFDHLQSLFDEYFENYGKNRPA